MGWYMVQSGMVDNPSVSQYRLTAHLLLAVVIFAAMLWVALDVLALRARAVAPAADAPASRRLFGWSVALVGFVLLTIASGGFVAGLKAGFTYNTFPLMNGQLVPDGIALMDPWWRNAFENITTIQFNHRWLAMTLAACVVGFGVFAWGRVRGAGARRALGLMLAAVTLQVTLGITTLLMVVPIPLAAAHQAGAVALLAALVYVAHVLRPQRGVTPPGDG
jgi:cytochrome c oxidase assembly protein subunit 15